MIKKMNFEMEVNDAKEFIKEIEKHLHKSSTSVVFCLESTQDEHDKSFDVARFDVGYGGQK
jgi:hypothetical protein